jgi:anti-anti-sigma regulatory factor
VISISGLPDGIVVTIHGDVHPELLDQVLADVSGDPANAQVVIDLRDAGPLDLNGLAVISDASGRVRRHRGRLVLCSPYRTVRSALEREGLQVAPSQAQPPRGQQGG